MPVFIDILENTVIGPAFKKSLEEGKLEGELEGELKIVRRLIDERFGAIPEWAEEQLATRTKAELEELSVRIFDAPSVEDFLR